MCGACWQTLWTSDIPIRKNLSERFCCLTHCWTPWTWQYRLSYPFNVYWRTHPSLGSAVNVVNISAFIKPPMPLQNCVSCRDPTTSRNIIFSTKLSLNFDYGSRSNEHRNTKNSLLHGPRIHGYWNCITYQTAGALHCPFTQCLSPHHSAHKYVNTYCRTLY